MASRLATCPGPRSSSLYWKRWTVISSNPSASDKLLDGSNRSGASYSSSLKLNRWSSPGPPTRTTPPGRTTRRKSAALTGEKWVSSTSTDAGRTGMRNVPATAYSPSRSRRGGSQAAQVVALAAAGVQHHRGSIFWQVPGDDLGDLVCQPLIVAVVEEVPPRADHLAVVSRVFGVTLLGKQQVDVALPSHVEDMAVGACERRALADQRQPARGTCQDAAGCLLWQQRS